MFCVFHTGNTFIPRKLCIPTEDTSIPMKMDPSYKLVLDTSFMCITPGQLPAGMRLGLDCLFYFNYLGLSHAKFNYKLFA